MSSIRRPKLIFNDTFLSGGVETPGIPASEVLTLTGSPIAKNVGDADFAATYTVVDANGVTRTGMKLRSSDRKVVRVNANGTLRVMGGGSCTLELDSAAGSGTIAVTVAGATYTGEDPDTGVYRYGVVLGGGGGGGGVASQPGVLVTHTNSIYYFSHYAAISPEFYGWTVFEGNHPAKNWEDLRGFAATEVDAHRSATLPNRLVLYEGTNQAVGAVTVADGQAAWTGHGLVYVQERLAAGWLASELYLCGTLYSGAGTGYATTTAMDAYNAMARAWCQSVGAHYVDFPADPVMGTLAACSDLTLYNSDKIHPLPAGHDYLWADLMAAMLPSITSAVPAWLSTLAASVEALNVGVHLNMVYTADGVMVTKAGSEVTTLTSEYRWQRPLTNAAGAGTGPQYIAGTPNKIRFNGTHYLFTPATPGDGFIATDDDTQSLFRHTLERYGFTYCAAIPSLPASNLPLLGAGGASDLYIDNAGVMKFFVPGQLQTVATLTPGATVHTITCARTDAGGQFLFTAIDGVAGVEATYPNGTFNEPRLYAIGTTHPGNGSANVLNAPAAGAPSDMGAVFFWSFDSGKKMTQAVHNLVRAACQAQFGAA